MDKDIVCKITFNDKPDVFSYDKICEYEIDFNNPESFKNAKRKNRNRSILKNVILERALSQSELEKIVQFIEENYSDAEFCCTANRHLQEYFYISIGPHLRIENLAQTIANKAKKECNSIWDQICYVYAFLQDDKIMSDLILGEECKIKTARDSYGEENSKMSEADSNAMKIAYIFRIIMEKLGLPCSTFETKKEGEDKYGLSWSAVSIEDEEKGISSALICSPYMDYLNKENNQFGFKYFGIDNSAIKEFTSTCMWKPSSYCEYYGIPLKYKEARKGDFIYNLEKGMEKYCSTPFGKEGVRPFTIKQLVKGIDNNRK